MSERIVNVTRSDEVAISSLQQQRTRAEHALRAAHDTFRHLVERSPFGLYVVDADFRLVQVSDGAQKVFANVRPLLGRDFAEVMHQLWPERFAEEALGRFRHTLKTGEPYRCTRTVEQRRDVDDTEAYDWRIERIALPDGRPGVVCHFYDLTEREQILREVRRGEERFRILADAMPQLVWTADADGNVDYYNARSADYHGIRRGDDGKWEWQPLVHPDDVDRTAEAWRVAHATGETYHCEHRVRMADGSYRWHLSRAVCSGADCSRWYGTATDVHELKAVQMELADSEERFRMLADNMSQLAWMADASGWLFWYNKRWLEYTGATIQEMRGEGWRQVHDPALVDQVAEKFKRHVEAGIEWEDTFPLRGVDGKYRWFLSRAKPIRDARGRVMRWFGTNTDVTEQRELAQALKEAGQRKDEFLATLAHELRNPLAAINGAVQIVRRKGDDAARREHSVDVLQRQVKHLSRLIDDLMDVSRVSRGKVTLQMEQVDLRSAVAQALEMARPLAEERRLSITSQMPDAPVPVTGDPARLLQVVGNLLNNACKFTEPGGTVVVKLEHEARDAALSVSDTGIGIPPEKIAGVFELFAQLDTSLTRSNAGLGIGLSLVRDLLNLHGGSIAAHSDGLGRGSTFVVRLPVSQRSHGAPGDAVAGKSTGATSPLAEAPRGAGAQMSTAARRSVLVVDDNRDSSASLAELLTMSGFAVTQAHDGNAAVEAFERSRPDAVVLDLGLPGIDGREVARRIRAMPGARQPMLVALTGWGQDEDRRRSSEAGFDWHLVKPCDVDALATLLRDGSRS